MHCLIGTPKKFELLVSSTIYRYHIKLHTRDLNDKLNVSIIVEMLVNDKLSQVKSRDQNMHMLSMY